MSVERDKQIDNHQRQVEARGTGRPILWPIKEITLEEFRKLYPRSPLVEEPKK
jgi:hypothetical protein